MKEYRCSHCNKLLSPFEINVYRDELASTHFRNGFRYISRSYLDKILCDKCFRKYKILRRCFIISSLMITVVITICIIGNEYGKHGKDFFRFDIEIISGVFAFLFGWGVIYAAFDYVAKPIFLMIDSYFQSRKNK